MRVAAAVLVVGCGPKAVPIAYPTDLQPVAMAQSDAFLLYQPGADPVGAFASGDPAPGVDERGPGRTSCSAFLSLADSAPTLPPHGLVHAGADAAVRAGRPSPKGTSVVWAELSALPGRRASIGDPNGLATCCLTTPEACTGWYVSETWVGTGRLHHPEQGEDGAIAWTAGATIHQSPWAFRLSSNPYATPDCGSWQLELPVAQRGVFALGVSNATFSERTARADAVARLREGMLLQLRQRGLSDGLVDQMREERWCVEAFPGAGGEQWIAQVLAYVSLTP